MALPRIVISKPFLYDYSMKVKMVQRSTKETDLGILLGIADRPMLFEKTVGSDSGTHCFNEAVYKTRSLTWTP